MNLKPFLVFFLVVYAFSLAAMPYNKKANLKGGKERESAVDFSLPDTTGQIVSLHDYLGKFVIISMGAGWCGSCHQELSAMKQLQRDFKNQEDIVWIFVSFDKDKKSFIESVNADNLSGIHLLGTHEAESLKKLFDFSKLPYYIWIDKDGKIAENNAPRPSSNMAREELKLYLK
jgi:cytochrome oxidase Cu insertion factor (SCO1/SenC/PrrC family)